MLSISPQTAHFYPANEERLNVASHALGLILSAAGLVFLLIKAITFGDNVHVISSAVFGISLVILYAASTSYHTTRTDITRIRLRAFDHASIYVLIAGTYTPIALLVLKGTVGWAIFSVAWAMAAVGVIIKLKFTGHLVHVSTGMYVFMGWIVVFAYEPLIANFSAEGLSWLLAGGLSYTVGALFYSMKRMPFAHATFHFFVLAGSICHFITVYCYVLTTDTSL